MNDFIYTSRQTASESVGSLNLECKCKEGKGKMTAQTKLMRTTGGRIFSGVTPRTRPKYQKQFPHPVKKKKKGNSILKEGPSFI